jgi:peptide deformylase
VTLVVALVALPLLYADPHAFIEGASPYVRHGHDGVDLHVRARALERVELESGFLAHASAGEERTLARVEARAAELLAADDDETLCVCAPMFGWRHRLVSVLHASADGDLRVLHMYNAEAHAGENASEYLVTESQRALFPAHIDAVEVVRRSPVRIAYRTRGFDAGAVLLYDELAFCVQAALDLLDGRSIYDRAAPSAE